MTERWVCNRCFTSAEADVAACPSCGLIRGAEGTRPVPSTVEAESLDLGDAEPGSVVSSWPHRVGPILRVVSAALWFAVALAGLAAVLVAPSVSTWIIAVAVGAPFAVGVACLLQRGVDLLWQSVGIVVLIGLTAFTVGIVFLEPTDPGAEVAGYVWFYLFVAAIGTLVIRGLWAVIYWIWSGPQTGS